VLGALYDQDNRMVDVGGTGANQMLIVRGGFVLTMDPQEGVIEDGAVAVRGTDIVAVGPFSGLAAQYPSARVLGSADDWILPGLINAHCHAGTVAGSFRQGIIDLPLERWLMRLYNSPLLEGETEITYLNTLYQNAQLIRSGVTCTVDFYYGDGTQPYMGADRALKAYNESGLRVAFALCAVDRASVDNGDLESFLPLLPAALAQRVRAVAAVPHRVSARGYVDAWERILNDFFSNGGTTSFLIAADGPDRCTSELLRRLKAEAQEHGTGIQMHLLETKYQRLRAKREMGTSLVRYLADLSFLGPEVSLAHGVWVSSQDIDLIAESGASVVHNPSSNLRLFDGVAPAMMMVDRGVNVALGTDNFGFSDDNDFLEEIRLASLLQRVPGIEGRSLSGQTLLRMASINGARALGLDHLVGSLAPGKKADLIGISAQRMLAPYMSPSHVPQEILWRRARREDVRHVIVNGQILMEEGRLTTIEIGALERELRDWYVRVWEARSDREKAMLQMLREVDSVAVDVFGKYEEEDRQASYVYNAC
jgi:5-methylthioadenosine/S-adenosylhomocysteine deaminase